MISNKLVALGAGLSCALIFGGIFAKDVMALCGYAEVTCEFPKKLRQDLHPNLVDCIDGASPACVTHSVTGTVTRTFTGTASFTGTGTGTLNRLAKWAAPAHPCNGTTYGGAAVIVGAGDNVCSPGGTVYRCDGDEAWTLIGGSCSTATPSKYALGAGSASDDGTNVIIPYRLFVGSLMTDTNISFGVNSNNPNPIWLQGASADSIGVKVVNTSASGAPPALIMLQGGSTAWGLASWQHASVVEGQADGGLVVGAYAGPVKFYASASRTEQMRLTTSGRLGIGTTAPATTLDVNGFVKVGTDTSTSVDKLVVNADIGGITVDGPGLSIVSIKSSSNNGGRLSFANPLGAWSLNNMQGQFYLYNNLSGGYPWRVTSSNQVGVNHAADSDVRNALDVNGNVRAQNLMAVEGAEFVYRTAAGTATATDTGTGTSQYLDYLRPELTLRVTSTATATTSAMGSLNAASPAYLTTGTSTTHLSSAAMSATPTVQVEERTLRATYPVRLGTDTGTNTASSMHMSYNPVVSVDAATASAASKLVQARTDGKIDTGWLPSVGNIYAASPAYLTVGTSTATQSAVAVEYSPTVHTAGSLVNLWHGYNESDFYSDFGYAWSSLFDISISASAAKVVAIGGVTVSSTGAYCTVRYTMDSTDDVVLGATKHVDNLQHVGLTRKFVLTPGSTHTLHFKIQAAEGARCYVPQYTASLVVMEFN